MPKPTPDKSLIQTKLRDLYKLIGFRIREDYATIAITCSEYGEVYGMTNQEALAIVGDHVLKLLVSSSLFGSKPAISRSELNDTFQEVGTNARLESIGGKVQIDRLLLALNQDLKGNKKRATSLEAIIGAIFLSKGLEKARMFCSKLEIIKPQKQLSLQVNPTKSILDIIPKSILESKLAQMSEYGYQSLVFCVIDSVFSIGVRYTSTIRTVKRFATAVGRNIHDPYSVQEFITRFGKINHEKMANEIYQNRQRTSTRSGILKAEAVSEFLKVLHSFQIETKQDFLKQKTNQKLIDAIQRIKGQSQLTTFDYLLMLSGDTGTFKRDRHIINFFADYMGVKNTDYDSLKTEFEKQLDVVSHVYPEINIRTLDGAIWQFMSEKK